MNRALWLLMLLGVALASIAAGAQEPMVQPAAGAAPATLPEMRISLVNAPPLAELVVHGTNLATVPRKLVVRVDDKPWPDYADRVNEERIVPPGPFQLRLRLAALRTPRNRALDYAQLRQAIAFAPDGDLQIATPTLEQPAALPEGTFGWFFGPADAVPLAGLVAVDLHDPAISGPSLNQVHRPTPDPVLAWGTRLTRFAGTLPPGAWHLTLWTEDPGDWETLPAVLERRIRLNGVDLVMERRTDAQWVQSRYLAGRAIEADPAAAPYVTLGARRGGRIDADVTLPDGKFVLELAGHPQAATQLSLLTAAPLDRAQAAARAVDEVRAARFAESWPVLDHGPFSPGMPAAAIGLDGATTLAAAPGGVAIFHLSLHSPTAATAQAKLSGEGAQLLWGMWRWRRPAPETPGLVLSAAHLRADTDNIPLRPDLPRELVVLARVPANAAAGRRDFHLSVAASTSRIEQTLHLDVLPIQRPDPRARVGAFLDLAPHLAYDPAAARRQAVCDLDTLHGLGLTAVAPPLSPPGADLTPFLEDLRAVATRFPPPYVAYAPARRLLWQIGAKETAATLARADAAARLAGLTPPVWTVADEPSAAGTIDAARDLAEHIRVAERKAQLAGHLNDADDSRILQLLDLVTVNARFGADVAQIAALRADGHQVWLYNLPRMRLAAGFYLWQSGAAGLLQWHARMPTADAFDPTDGREGDVQFLWPTPEVCQTADLDNDLLELVEGEEDLRWLAWLDQAAGRNVPGAAALLAALHAEVPNDWRHVAALPDNAADLWRARIMRLARGLSR